jgi:hypothetical protein
MGCLAELIPCEREGDHNYGEITMSEEDQSQAGGRMKWLLLAMLQMRHANWNKLTADEQRALFDNAFEEMMDGMVADGVFRCLGATPSGRKIYQITDAGRRAPRRPVKP